MREPTKATIGEIEYCVTPLNPIKGAKTLTRLLKIVGEPLAKIIKNAKPSKDGGSILDLEIEGDVLGIALEALVGKLEENEVERLLKDLLNSNHVTFSADGEEFLKMADIDAHFAGIGGGLMNMFKLLKVSLEANYSDFFGGLAALKK